MVTSYKPYSVALFELAKEIDKVAFYLEELESLTTIWNENDDFKKALRHPKITRLQKREWISQLFEKELDSMLYRFLLVMIEHDVIGYIPEIKDAYIEVYKEDLNIGLESFLGSLGVSLILFKLLDFLIELTYD